MIHISFSMNRRGRFQLAALLGTSGVLAAVLLAPSMGAASPQAATSSAVTYQVGETLAHDEFDRTGHSLGHALVGGRWATASPTGLLTLAGGAATWSGFTRGQTTHAWLPAVSASDQLMVASFSFGVISRAHYGMSHRTVVRRQTNGDGYVTAASVLSNGQVSLGLSRVSNRVVTSLVRVPVAATLTTGKVLNVQTRVVGTTRVQLLARVWVVGAPSPGWQIVYTDSSPQAISSPGAVGVNAYMGSVGAGRAVTLTRLISRELVAPA